MAKEMTKYELIDEIAEEVIRRCIEDEYREDDVNAMGRCE